MFFKQKYKFSLGDLVFHSPQNSEVFGVLLHIQDREYRNLNEESLKKQNCYRGLALAFTRNEKGLYVPKDYSVGKLKPLHSSWYSEDTLCCINSKLLDFKTLFPYIADFTKELRYRVN